MIEQLEALKRRFQEIEEQLSDPAIVQDIKRYATLNKAHKKLSRKVAVYDTYRKVVEEIEGLKALIHSREEQEDIRQMAKEELVSLTSQHDTLEEELKALLLPEDPEEDKNCLLEIRAGAGGDEAAIWAGGALRLALAL